jgi:hypothetical protein
MSINNNDARTLSGIAVATESVNIPSTIDAIRIGGDIGSLREVIGKDAITNKVRWLDITDTQIEDDSIVPRMIDSSQNFTFTDVNCRNLSATSVVITTSLTLPDISATNELEMLNAGVQVWSVNKTGLMEFIKDATADPYTTYTTIYQGLLTTEKIKATTEIRVNNRFYVDAVGNLIFYNTDGTTELASIKQGVADVSRLTSRGGITNSGAFIENGNSTFTGNITQVGDTFNSNAIMTLTKATSGTDYTFTGNLDLNNIEAHLLKIKTNEDDPDDDVDIFVVDGADEETPVYRQVKLYTGLEVWDRTNPAGADRKIQMDMKTGNITTQGGFSGNLFAFQTGSINGELLCGDITARNGVNGRFFVDVNMTADKGSVELIGDYYGQNFYITNNGRIIDASLDPPAPGTKLISLKQNGDIDCINLTATTKVKATTIETDNFIYTGNIDLGNIEAKSLTIESDAIDDMIVLSSTTGTIKGIKSQVGHNHQLDRLDIHSSLTFQSLSLAKTLEMIQSTGQINQSGSGGIVQSSNTTTENVFQKTEINDTLEVKGKITATGDIETTAGQVKCDGIISSDGGAINGAEFQVNKGLVVENPPPVGTPEGYALTLNGKSIFNQEVDFIGTPIDFGRATDLINTDVVNFFGHDLDMFGSILKLYKMTQTGTELPAEIRTFDNTSLPPVATGTIISSEGYVESKDIRPTKSIKYEYTAENGQNELYGASATHRTICKNLDLSDDSNVLPVNPVSLEFGIYYSPNPAVAIESDDEDWKYWGDNLFCTKPVYSDSTLTTIEIDMTYNIRNDAFGNFFIGLASSTDNGITKTFVNDSDQFCPLQSAPGIGSMRNQFVKRYVAVIENQPYNQAISYYPIFRTNTNNDDGLIRVEHGGNHAGLTFPPCVMMGRPFPSTYRNHRTLDYAGGLI